MLIELNVQARVGSKSDLDELYCVLYGYFPSLFEILKEKEFSYSFKKASIKWAGEVKDSKRLNVKLLVDKLEEAFYASGLKKCRYGITANGENYEYIFTKRKKEFLNENYKQGT